MNIATIPTRSLYVTGAITSLGLILFAVAAHGFYSYKQYEYRKQARETLINEQYVVLRDVREEIALLRSYTSELENRFVKENETLKEELAQAAKERLASEQQARSRIDSLSAQVAANGSVSLENVINEWKARVAYLTCTYGASTGTGSALIGRVDKISSPGFGAITSEHVVTSSYNTPASSCTVRLSNGSRYTVKGSSIDIDLNEEDVAVIKLGNEADISAIASKPLTICSTKAAIGDQVVILGFPSIGARNDITATEGIISGYDGNYYITSAKVERGNSGGVAVLAKKNCYLGIPTFAYRGALESLARILDVRSIGL